MRQLALDTETTGMNQDGGEVSLGHRIIEIGAVELIKREITGNNYHVYMNPEQEVDPEAEQVHGFSWQDLQDKPLFAEVADGFINFIQGAELIIHNAPFDLSFLNHELNLLNQQLGEQKYGRIEDYCSVIDSLEVAKLKHPGMRNNLDALCKRYSVDNTGRELHGALLDSELLAEVYLALTGGQAKLGLSSEEEASQASGLFDPLASRRLVSPELASQLTILTATEAELAAHQAKLSELTDPLWLN